MEKTNGILKFIKEASTTIFALGVLGSAGWLLTSVNAANLSLAVISTQLTGINNTVIELKAKSASDKSDMMLEISDLKQRIAALERK